PAPLHDDLPVIEQVDLFFLPLTHHCGLSSEERLRHHHDIPLLEHRIAVLPLADLLQADAQVGLRSVAAAPQDLDRLEIGPLGHAARLGNGLQEADRAAGQLFQAARSLHGAVDVDVHGAVERYADDVAWTDRQVQLGIAVHQKVADLHGDGVGGAAGDGADDE